MFLGWVGGWNRVSSWGVLVELDLFLGGLFSGCSWRGLSGVVLGGSLKALFGGVVFSWKVLLGLFWGRSGRIESQVTSEHCGSYLPLLLLSPVKVTAEARIVSSNCVLCFCIFRGDYFHVLK